MYDQVNGGILYKMCGKVLIRRACGRGTIRSGILRVVSPPDETLLMRTTKKAAAAPTTFPLSLIPSCGKSLVDIPPSPLSNQLTPDGFLFFPHVVAEHDDNKQHLTADGRLQEEQRPAEDTGESLILSLVPLARELLPTPTRQFRREV